LPAAAAIRHRDAEPRREVAEIDDLRSGSTRREFGHHGMCVDIRDRGKDEDGHRVLPFDAHDLFSDPPAPAEASVHKWAEPRLRAGGKPVPIPDRSGTGFFGITR
jgi:hypothetical protein